MSVESRILREPTGRIICSFPIPIVLQVQLTCGGHRKQESLCFTKLPRSRRTYIVCLFQTSMSFSFSFQEEARRDGIEIKTSELPTIRGASQSYCQPPGLQIFHIFHLPQPPGNRKSITLSSCICKPIG